MKSSSFHGFLARYNGLHHTYSQAFRSNRVNHVWSNEQRQELDVVFDLFQLFYQTLIDFQEDT